MPIRIEQPGVAQLYGKAATLAGKAQRAREKEQIAIRAREIEQEQKLREEAQIRSIEAAKEQQLRSIQASKQQQQSALEAQRVRAESAQIQTALRIRAQEESERERLESLQIEQEYRRNMKLLDAQLDLETFERAKRWEIDKMEIASRVDFEREEQIRQRKLNSVDSAIQQIDKEVLAGRITEQEAYPIKQKLELSKLGVHVPTSAFEERKVDPMQHLIGQLLGEGEAGGISPETGVTGQMPIYIKNPETGERRVSYDGGNTWKPVAEGVAEKPTVTKPKPKPYGSVYREWL